VWPQSSFAMPFYTKNEHYFAKTGSGQTQGKHSKGERDDACSSQVWPQWELSTVIETRCFSLFERCFPYLVVLHLSRACLGKMIINFSSCIQWLKCMHAFSGLLC
jgi:hypothetical protein